MPDHHCRPEGLRRLHLEALTINDLELLSVETSDLQHGDVAPLPLLEIRNVHQRKHQVPVLVDRHHQFILAGCTYNLHHWKDLARHHMSDHHHPLHTEIEKLRDPPPENDRQLVYLLQNPLHADLLFSKHPLGRVVVAISQRLSNHLFRLITVQRTQDLWHLQLVLADFPEPLVEVDS